MTSAFDISGLNLIMTSPSEIKIGMLQRFKKYVYVDGMFYRFLSMKVQVSDLNKEKELVGVFSKYCVY